MTPAQQFAAWAGLAGHEGLIAGAEFVPLVVRDETIGLAMLDGTEIHFAVAPAHRGRAIQRHRCRAFLAPLIERRGLLTTRAMRDAGHERFLTRLGFAKTGETGPIDHYMLAALPFGDEEH